MEKKAVNKKTWVIVGIVVALLAVLGVGGYIISRGGAGTDESLLELGQRYLEELNYEQAIVCFEEYLEIDPQCVEAYAGLAQAYVGLGEYEKALEVLADGYAVTGDGSLRELRGRIEQQYREILLVEGNSGFGEGTGDEGSDEMAEPEEKFVGSLVLDTATVGIVAGNGGVIVTVKNDLYGAINYQGKEIVPHIYSSWWTAPTDDGYFALGDSETAHVFNAEGQEVLVIKAAQNVFISDGGVLYRAGVGELIVNEWAGMVQTYYSSTAIKWYDLLQGTTTDLGESERYIAVSPMQDGTAYYLSEDPDDPYGPVMVSVITKDGADEILTNSRGRYWWIGSSSEGFIPMIDNTAREGTQGIALLRETDGKEYYISCGFFPWVDDNSIFSKIYYASIAGGYYKDGVRYWSRGAQIVIAGVEDPSWDIENGRTYEDPSYYLVDFTNAKFGTNEYGAEIITNPNELILAHYDYIALSDSGYYQASDGESWFYLDERGQRVNQTFLDCGTFYNGYSIIIDTDGMAYLIDTEFNKVSEGYPADRVYTAEAIYCVESGNQVTILTAPEE